MGLTECRLPVANINAFRLAVSKAQLILTESSEPVTAAASACSHLRFLTVLRHCTMGFIQGSLLAAQRYEFQLVAMLPKDLEHVLQPSAVQAPISSAVNTRQGMIGMQ